MVELAFNLGAQVHCRDGRCGRLVKIIVDPRTQRVTDLVVEKGLLLKHDRVVPFSAVERANDKDIYLNISSDELIQLTEFVDPLVEEPTPDADKPQHNPKNALGSETSLATAAPLPNRRPRETLSAKKAALGAETQVVNLHQTLGYLDQVGIYPESGKISRLVMRRGLIPQRLVLPMQQIEQIEEQEILVSLANEEVVGLRHYERREDETMPII